MESKNADKLRRIGYVIVLLVVSLPLFCGYILEGGDVVIWIRRIDEVRAGFRSPWNVMFPTPALIAECGGEFSALNSNLWLFLPAFFRWLGFSITNTYRIYILLLNLLALWGTYKFFSKWTENKWMTFVGVLLFMTCPYRIYICYDKADLGMVATWAFIPIAFWSVLCFCTEKADWKKMVLSSLSIAAVAYGNVVLWMAVLGISVLGIIWSRKWKGLFPILAGIVLSIPGMIKWLQYLFMGISEYVNLPLRFAAPDGYVLGQFFSSWVYREGCPGFGLGIMLGLALFGWLCFIEKESLPDRRYSFEWCILLLMVFMSMQRFPWDILQRLGAPLLRLISLIEMPGMFFGFACLVASGFCAYAIEAVRKQEKLFVKWGFPVILIVVAIGICVYMCNNLTYYRFPIYL